MRQLFGEKSNLVVAPLFHFFPVQGNGDYIIDSRQLIIRYNHLAVPIAKKISDHFLISILQVMNKVFYDSMVREMKEGTGLSYVNSSIKDTIYRVFFVKGKLGEWQLMSTNGT